jgi:haloalkane dehalogenase
MTSRQAIDAHRAAGRRFTAASLESFVRDEGTGESVICLHGVPASSFLYRKVLSELAARGLRGIAFDLPGLGLADRPAGRVRLHVDRAGPLPRLGPRGCGN